MDSGWNEWLSEQRCAICRKPFTLDEWDERHTFDEKDVHEKCCPECNEDSKTICPNCGGRKSAVSKRCMKCRQPRNAERDAEIYSEYTDPFAGATMESIGEKYGLTRQRVYQIIQHVKRVEARKTKAEAM